MAGLFRKRQFKPWIASCVVAQEKKIKSKVVKVLCRRSNDRHGCVVMLVSDGELSISAAFSSEAVDITLSNIGLDRDTRWDNALLILQECNLELQVNNGEDVGEYVVYVEKFNIWDLQPGYTAKFDVKYCMEDSKVSEMMTEEVKAMKERAVCMSDEDKTGSIGLSQLLDEMAKPSESLSQSSCRNVEDRIIKCAENKGLTLTESLMEKLLQPFSVNEFLIPESQAQVLQNITEWQPDYQPEGDTPSTSDRQFDVCAANTLTTPPDKKCQSSEKKRGQELSQSVIYLGISVTPKEQTDEVHVKKRKHLSGPVNALFKVGNLSLSQGTSSQWQNEIESVEFSFEDSNATSSQGMVVELNTGLTLENNVRTSLLQSQEELHELDQDEICDKSNKDVVMSENNLQITENVTKQKDEMSCNRTGKKIKHVIQEKSYIESPRNVGNELSVKQFVSVSVNKNTKTVTDKESDIVRTMETEEDVKLRSGTLEKITNLCFGNEKDSSVLMCNSLESIQGQTAVNTFTLNEGSIESFELGSPNAQSTQINEKEKKCREDTQKNTSTDKEVTFQSGKENESIIKCSKSMDEKLQPQLHDYNEDDLTSQNCDGLVSSLDVQNTSMMMNCSSGECDNRAKIGTCSGSNTDDSLFSDVDKTVMLNYYSQSSTSKSNEHKKYDVLVRLAKKIEKFQTLRCKANHMPAVIGSSVIKVEPVDNDETNLSVRRSNDSLNKHMKENVTKLDEKNNGCENEACKAIKDASNSEEICDCTKFNNSNDNDDTVSQKIIEPVQTIRETQTEVSTVESSDTGYPLVSLSLKEHFEENGNLGLLSDDASEYTDLEEVDRIHREKIANYYKTIENDVVQSSEQSNVEISKDPIEQHMENVKMVNERQHLNLIPENKHQQTENCGKHNEENDIFRPFAPVYFETERGSRRRSKRLIKKVFSCREKDHQLNADNKGKSLLSDKSFVKSVNKYSSEGRLMNHSANKMVSGESPIQKNDQEGVLSSNHQKYCDKKIENSNRVLPTMNEDVTAVLSKGSDSHNTLSDSVVHTNLYGKIAIGDISYNSKRLKYLKSQSVVEYAESATPVEDKGMSGKIVTGHAKRAMPFKEKGVGVKIITEQSKSAIPFKEKGVGVKILTEHSKSAIPFKEKGVGVKIVTNHSESAVPIKHGKEKGMGVQIATEHAKGAVPTKEKGESRKKIRNSQMWTKIDDNILRSFTESNHVQWKFKRNIHIMLERCDKKEHVCGEESNENTTGKQVVENDNDLQRSGDISAEISKQNDTVNCLENEKVSSFRTVDNKKSLSRENISDLSHNPFRVPLSGNEVTSDVERKITEEERKRSDVELKSVKRLVDNSKELSNIIEIKDKPDLIGAETVLKKHTENSATDNTNKGVLRETYSSQLKVNKRNDSDIESSISATNDVFNIPSENIIGESSAVDDSLENKHEKCQTYNIFTSPLQNTQPFEVCQFPETQEFVPESPTKFENESSDLNVSADSVVSSIIPRTQEFVPYLSESFVRTPLAEAMTSIYDKCIPEINISDTQNKTLKGQLLSKCTNNGSENSKELGKQLMRKSSENHFFTKSFESINALGDKLLDIEIEPEKLTRNSLDNQVQKLKTMVRKSLEERKASDDQLLATEREKVKKNRDKIETSSIVIKSSDDKSNDEINELHCDTRINSAEQGEFTKLVKKSEHPTVSNDICAIVRSGKNLFKVKPCRKLSLKRKNKSGDGENNDVSIQASLKNWKMIKENFTKSFEVNIRSHDDVKREEKRHTASSVVNMLDSSDNSCEEQDMIGNPAKISNTFTKTTYDDKDMVKDVEKLHEVERKGKPCKTYEPSKVYIDGNCFGNKVFWHNYIDSPYTASASCETKNKSCIEKTNMRKSSLDSSQGSGKRDSQESHGQVAHTTAVNRSAESLFSTENNNNEVDKDNSSPESVSLLPSKKQGEVSNICSKVSLKRQTDQTKLKEPLKVLNNTKSKGTRSDLLFTRSDGVLRFYRQNNAENTLNVPSKVSENLQMRDKLKNSRRNNINCDKFELNNSAKDMSKVNQTKSRVNAVVEDKVTNLETKKSSLNDIEVLDKNMFVQDWLMRSNKISEQDMSMTELCPPGMVTDDECVQFARRKRRKIAALDSSSDEERCSNYKINRQAKKIRIIDDTETLGSSLQSYQPVSACCQKPQNDEHMKETIFVINDDLDEEQEGKDNTGCNLSSAESSSSVNSEDLKKPMSAAARYLLKFKKARREKKKREVLKTKLERSTTKLV